ncbi:MAG: T9SS type A sorting domain-containing protein [Flavobacteriales bacterium]|mgnify:CR=1 FL=1|nr:T9SS type A sorting domain-containing protein [Flavobacteriales bacterium]
MIMQHSRFLLVCLWVTSVCMYVQAQDVRGYAISLSPIDFVWGEWQGTVHLYVDGVAEVPRPFIREFGFGLDTLWLTNTVQVDDDPVILLKEYAGILHLDPAPSTTGAVFYVGPRLSGILNVPNSEGTIMNIQSRVTINGLTGTLCTLPLASNYQSNVTEVNGVYSYLPGLVDPDGDSLAIELIPCVDEGYWLPPQTQIDPLTGELTISPELPGAYAFCMWIRKFRYFGPTGSQQLAVTGTTYLEIMIDVTNTVGLGEYGADNGFVVFPNPTTASFFMRGLPPSTTTIEVHDVLGRVVLRSTAPTIPIDVGSLPAATYFVSVFDRTGLLLGTSRFVKQ